MPINLSLEFDALFSRAQKIGLKQQHLADYSDVSASKISRAVNGVEDLNYAELRTLRRLIDALEVISARSGVPVDWRERRTVQKLVDEFYKDRETPPSPLSPAEAILLHRFAQGEALDDLSVETRQSRTELLETITNLLQRTSRITQMEAAKQ